MKQNNNKNNDNNNNGKLIKAVRYGRQNFLKLYLKVLVLLNSFIDFGSLFTFESPKKNVSFELQLFCEIGNRLLGFYSFQ